MMTELRWKHGKTLSEMNDLIQQYLTTNGYIDKVQWHGNSFSASVGMGLALNIKGQITDHEIVIEKCSGIGGSVVLTKIRETLQKNLPGGEIE